MNDSPAERPSFPSLIAPFAAVGALAVLGMELATRASEGLAPGVAVLAAMTACLYAGVGGWLTSHYRGGGSPWTIVATPLLPAFVCFLLSVVAMPPAAMYGCAFGFVVGLAYLPPLFFVQRAARRVGRARPGSLVDACDRRGVWRPTLGTIVALSLGRILVHKSPERFAPLHLLIATCAAVLMLLAIVDVIAYARISAAEAGRGRPLDLGVGADVVEARGRDTYRTAIQRVTRIMGDPRVARRLLLRALAFDAAALACAIITLAVYARGHGALWPVARTLERLFDLGPIATAG
jgi:hypothetical protein